MRAAQNLGRFIFSVGSPPANVCVDLVVDPAKPPGFLPYVAIKAELYNPATGFVVDFAETPLGLHHYANPWTPTLTAAWSSPLSVRVIPLNPDYVDSWELQVRSC